MEHPLVWAGSIFLILYNLAAFAIMFWDKQKARRHARRIPERTLFLLAATLAGPGIWCGVYAFRHKTRHTTFKVGMPLMLIVNIAAVIYLIK